MWFRQHFMIVTRSSVIRRTLKTMDDTFLYFGFGSNLLKERIHISNPSAKFVSPAKLKDYKLDFGFSASGKRGWMGAVATITECPGDHVWGVVWRLNKEHLASLDEQEGVGAKIYRPLEVTVETADGEPLKVRTYQLLGHHMSDDRKPSPHYLQVILTGAEENGLPEDYIKRLRKIEHNGYKGKVDLYSKLKSVKPL